MAGEDIERRLAAILSADVVGYSRLMGEDDAGTFAAVKALRKELFAPTVVEHHGRIVKLMGDGALVEFPSVVDAVECAVAVQRGVAERNSGIPEDKCIALRIGVNLGDIIIEGNDIYGDGVNVAARLQELAAPGGITLSATAHEHAMAKVDVGFVDGGEHELKNIAKPVRIYHWSDDADCGAGIADKESSLPLPDKPSIAVLPFTNMSGDAEQEYFSDGITEDIITELSRFRSLFVIARNSSFTFKGQAVDVTKIGRTLGVQYVVEGSIRKAGDQVRITAQLIEAETGNHVWAERYDRELEDIFAVQDEVVQAIVGTLVGRLAKAGAERALRKSGENLTAYDLLLRGKHYLERGSKDDVLEARAVFEQALELDPNHARTYTELAATYYAESVSLWSEAPDDAAERYFELARKAVALDDLDSSAHLLLGCAYHHAKANYELAEAQFETAIALNPNDVWNYCAKGYFLTCSGRLEEGISCDSYALRLNPLMPDPCLSSIGVAYYLGRRYEDAISTFGKMSYMALEIQGCLAASYAQLDRDDEALATAAEFLDRAAAEFAVHPGDDAGRWQAYWQRVIPIKEAADRDHLFDGLRKAGLPA